VIGSAVALVVVLAVPAAAAAPTGQAAPRPSRCVREFDEVQRQDMESFASFDVEAFRAVHHPDAITIFASGAMRSGIEAIMAALAPHFANRNATWTWTELHRFIDPACQTGYILYDATYGIPSQGFVQRALTSVTYVRERGHWLAIADQGTLLPPATG
jgi:hypothetical protein